MEKISVLGVDPSLRNSGLALVTYDSSLPVTNAKAFSASHCQVLVNPAKYTGTDAILNMIDMLSECAETEKAYQDAKDIIVESPAIMFNKTWSGGTISSIAHISGACVVIFGHDNARLFRPNEWNKSRKKDVTHNQTISVLGSPDTWGFSKRVKSEKYMEHVLDAASMALWWIKSNYLED